jgi:hypothetical protein
LIARASSSVMPHLRGLEVARLEHHAAAQGVLEGARLLVDLLEHEVLVPPALGLHERPGDARRGALDLLAGDLLDAVAAAADLGDLAVFEEDHVAGVGEERGDVAGREGDARRRRR